jgi:hypothetical protein
VVRKTPFVRHLVLKLIILPRQARDKHTGKAGKFAGVFLRGKDDALHYWYDMGMNETLLEVQYPFGPGATVGPNSSLSSFRCAEPSAFFAMRPFYTRNRRVLPRQARNTHRKKVEEQDVFRTAGRTRSCSTLTIWSARASSAGRWSAHWRLRSLRTCSCFTAPRTTLLPSVAAPTRRPRQDLRCCTPTSAQLTWIQLTSAVRMRNPGLSPPHFLYFKLNDHFTKTGSPETSIEKTLETRDVFSLRCQG